MKPRTPTAHPTLAPRLKVMNKGTGAQQWGDRNSTPLVTPLEQHTEDPAGELSQNALVGVVKSYNGSKGFGFIQSDGIDGDVLFSRHELPDDAKEVRGKFLEGKTVNFEAQAGVDGRPKAVRMTILPSEDDFMAGCIKSYSDRHQYGFITSSALAEDVRFERKDLDPFIPGAQLKGELVIFKAMSTPDGKLRVSQVRFQSGKIAEKFRTMTALNGMVGINMNPVPTSSIPTPTQAPVPTSAAVPSDGQMLGTQSGVVKSYNEKNGYGFINLPNSSTDIKFGRADVSSASIAVGAAVQFELTVLPDGRAQAKGVTTVQNQGIKRERGAPSFGIATAPEPKQSKVGFGAQGTGRFLGGTIKSYNAHKGFGFITTGTVRSDVFFMKSNLPLELQNLALQGRTASFELMSAPDGSYRAQNLTVT